MGIVESIEYDPNRSSQIAPVRWIKGGCQISPKGNPIWVTVLVAFLVMSLLIYFGPSLLIWGWHSLCQKIPLLLICKAVHHFLFSGLGWGTGGLSGLALRAILGSWAETPHFFIKMVLPLPSGASASSEWTEDSFEMDVLLEPFSETEAEGPPRNAATQRVGPDEAGPSHAPPIHNHPSEEVRAQEHDHIYRAVEGITEACEEEERAVIDKAHRLLQRKGIVLEDPTDVRRALGTALYDSWQTDIDHRLPHFRRIQQDFGTNRCCIWNLFVDELRDLGNPQVNARHKVD